MSNIARNQALRAGGACVRCRKGKTKCFYETAGHPCRNCEKGGHDCYLPSDREPPATLPTRQTLTRTVPTTPSERLPVSAPGRHIPTSIDKIGPELFAECERVVTRTFPTSIAFHKPSFIQQLKAGTLEPVLVFALLTVSARSSTSLIRRYGSQGAGSASVADTFAAKALSIINGNLDTPSLPDIQALCLLIIHEWGNRNAVRAYIFLGQAARMMQMHRILGPVSTQSDSDKFHVEESLRRTVWLMYILDCLLTSTPGRRSALDPADYDGMALPCQDMFFAFGNASHVPTLTNSPPKDMPAGAQIGEIGELGFIVIGTSIWRDVVHFLTGLKDAPFPDNDCNSFMDRIQDLRVALPMQYVDKPQQINLHITMGSGFTFAMLHSLIHCSSIFLQRRKMLDHMVPPSFVPGSDGLVPVSAEMLDHWKAEHEVWRASPQCQNIIATLVESCGAIIDLFVALDAQGGDKDSHVQFPIYMLFAAFSASATVAYLSLKGLTPRHSIDRASSIVARGLHFMSQAVEMWPLTAAWHRHLGVMERILSQEGSRSYNGSALYISDATAVGSSTAHRTHSVKDETASDVDTVGDATDAMDYEHARPGSSTGARAHSQARDGSEPPVPLPRRSGVTTINGNSVPGISTPATTGSPAAEPTARVPLPSSSSVSVPAVQPAPSPAAQQDMNAQELCSAFEKQLLELDDLAAFMGGGV